MNNIIQHDTKLHDITFSNILNLDEIQKLQDLFADAHGVASLITDINGNPITKPSNFTRLCDTIIRKTQKGCANCYKSDAAIGKYNPLGANSQPCLSGGLWDAGASITVGGKHIANWLIGQVRVEDTDEQELLKYADEIGVDRSEYKAALNEIPIMSVDKFKKIADLLFVIANELSEKAFNILQLRQQIAASNQNQNELKESEYLHRTVLQTAMDGYWMTDLEGKFIAVNEAYCHMSGYTEAELLSMHILDVDVIENKADNDKHIKNIITNGSDRFESKHRRKDGSVYDVEISTVYQNEYKNAFVVFIRDISEQKLAKNALLEAEWKFKALFDLGPIGVAYHSMIYDEAGEPFDYYFIDVNASYNELTGVNPKGMTVRQAFPGIENDPFDWIGLYGKVAKTGEAIRFEQYLEANGRWYDCVGYQYKPDHFVVAFNEITKRKQAEITLKESEMRFKVLFDDAPDAMLLADPETGKIIDANITACRLFKKQKHELIGLYQYELHPAQNEDYSKNTFKEHFENTKQNEKNEPFENKICCSDGSEIPVEIIGQAIHLDGKSLMLGTFRDITERKKTEEAMKQSEEKFRSFFENSVVGKSITTIEGKLSVNNSFCKIVGYSEAELNTLNWKDITHADDIELNANILSSILKGEKQSERWEKRYIHKDGHIVWVDISTSLQRDGNGNPLYFITAAIDITERKKAELLLENERALYLDLVNTQPAGIYRIRVSPKTSWEDDAWTKADNPPYKMELVNDRFCEILEIDPQKLELHPGLIIDLVHPDDKEEFVRRNEEAKTLVNTFKWDCRLLINNSIKWVHFESLPRKLENGDILFTGIIYDITDSKNAAEALRKSEEMMLSSQSVAHICSYSTNLNESDIEKSAWVCSPEFYNIFGMDETYPHTITGWVGFLHPDHRDEVAAYHESVVKNRTSFNHEYKIIRINDGAERWVHGTGELEYDEHNNPVRMYGAIQDITERKKVVEDLRESEEKYRSFIENSGLGVGVYSPDGKIILYNQKALENMGGKAEDYIGKTLFEVFDEQSANVYYNRIQDAIAIEQDIDYEDFVPLPSGEFWFTSNFTKIKNDKGEIIAVQIISQDISERKKAEQALKESEEKLSTLFNSMTELVVMHELEFDDKGNAIDYRILDCNKTFTAITGIQKENAIGRLATEVYGVELAPYLQEYANVALSGTALEFNTFYPPMDKYFLISVVSSGKNRFSTITTDITSNEQIHEIIREKNKELENYIYVASHDLRSPLVNIQGFSKRLQKQTTELTKIVAELNVSTKIAAEFSKITTDDIPKSLSFILNNVSKMDTLINGLLQVSRTGRVVMSPAILEMNKLFKSILTIFDYQLKEMEANVVLHDLDDCFGDTNQLNQLFSNIIGNALKYSDKNRILTLEISSQTKYNKVTYSIKDNGIGINNRHLQKIWDVFYRVDASAPEAGEGLGLSLAKRIVDKHKGKIWAESVEGEGSTFYVELHKNKFEE
jgi:PAS domain S-box-containing protein